MVNDRRSVCLSVSRNVKIDMMRGLAEENFNCLKQEQRRSTLVMVYLNRVTES